MQYLLPISVGSGQISAAVSEPEVKYRPGTVLVVKGLAWDAQEELTKQGLISGRVGEIDQRLAGFGNTVVALSHAGYDRRSMESATVSSYLSDLASAVETLESQSGRVALLGHSLGAYFAARLALMLKSSGHNCRTALIGPPMSPSKPFGQVADVYLRLPQQLRRIPAHIGIGILNIANKANYLGKGRPFPYRQQLIDELLAAPALDELVSSEEPLLGSDGLIMFGTRDLWIRREPVDAYAARCRKVARTVIPLEGQNHNLSSASDSQLKEIARTLDDFFCGK